MRRRTRSSARSAALCGCQNGKRGLATVELAVCMPVIALIVFASIEACSMIFLQQALQTTAYETARFAVARKSDRAAALDRGEQVIADRKVRGASIELDPVNPDVVDGGEEITATVSAPLNGNRRLPAFFFGDQRLSASVTMLKE